MFKQKSRKLIAFVLMLAIVLAGFTSKSYAKTEKLYELTVRSSYQVREGGKPEYLVTGSGQEYHLVVDSVDGATIKVPNGEYTIKEVKTTEGFLPVVEEVKIALPHIDEAGNVHERAILEMKSTKVEKELKFIEHTPDTPEPEKEEIIETGEGPGSLGEREKPEIEKGDDDYIDPGHEDDDGGDIVPEPIDDGEKDDTPTGGEKTDERKNPKTGDETFLLEIAGLFSIIIAAVVVVKMWKKKEVR